MSDKRFSAEANGLCDVLFEGPLYHVGDRHRAEVCAELEELCRRAIEMAVDASLSEAREALRRLADAAAVGAVSLEWAAAVAEPSEARGDARRAWRALGDEVVAARAVLAAPGKGKSDG